MNRELDCKVLTEIKAKNYVAVILESFNFFRDEVLKVSRGSIDDKVEKGLLSSGVSRAEFEPKVELNYEKISSVLKDYEKLACCIKMKMKQTEDGNIDRHKISAIMFMALLTNRDIVSVEQVVLTLPVSVFCLISPIFIMLLLLR